MQLVEHRIVDRHRHIVDGSVAQNISGEAGLRTRHDVRAFISDGDRDDSGGWLDAQQLSREVEGVRHSGVEEDDNWRTGLEQRARRIERLGRAGDAPPSLPRRSPQPVRNRPRVPPRSGGGRGPRFRRRCRGAGEPGA